MKIYKAVPGPVCLLSKHGKMQAAFDGFAAIMNEQSAQGWTYHSMQPIDVAEKQGIFRKPTTTQYIMLIFEKEAPAAADNR